MAIRLIFLGKLADLAGAAEREVSASASLGWTELVAGFDQPLREEICCERVRIALNGALLRDKEALLASDKDEIAFLPPVSGG